jgi:hypothetical protein
MTDPEVKDFPSEELASTATSSSLLHATNANEANNNHLKFFYHCFYNLVLMNDYGLIVQDAKYC